MQQKTPKIGLVSLGCAKNLVDSQRLTSVLVAMGYRIENEYSKCDVVVVNTCGFIGPAVEESMQAIGEALNYARKVIVTGCLGARAKLVMDRYPQVAAVYGPGMRATVIRGIVSLVGKPSESDRQNVGASGILLTPPHYAYLKIAEGCRHHCSFCIIPSLRGPLRSRQVDSILKESEDLVRRGVKELLVIAQDSSDYGMDLKNKTSLSSLLRKLGQFKRWDGKTDDLNYGSSCEGTVSMNMAWRRDIPNIVFVFDFKKEVEVGRIGIGKLPESWPYNHDLRNCEFYVGKTWSFKSAGTNADYPYWTGGGNLANYNTADDDNDWKLVLTATDIPKENGLFWYDVPETVSKADRTGRYLKIHPTKSYREPHTCEIAEIYVDGIVQGNTANVE